MRAPSKVPHHRRVRKVREQTKGYRGGRSKLYRTAKESLLRSGQFAYRDRKVRKRDFRRLWITRISIAARQRGMMYSRFINGLSKAGVELDRKMLAEMAVNDPKGFDEIVETAKKHLN
jgi:large subunit ribosomal protein L20